MNEILPPEDRSDEQKGGSKKNKWIRGGMNAVGGSIPFAGGFISAAAGVWGEAEQEEAMEALRAWMKMLQDEIREKQETIIEIMQRLDFHQEEITKRVRSDEYQSLLKKAFRNWAGAESKTKREYIRNLLTNAASISQVGDDVIKLFIEWLQRYSEFHFAVIAAIYHNKGATRGAVWRSLGKPQVREDSAEADLFKLLIRDLSTGGIVRQHREKDYNGQYIAKKPAKRPSDGGSKTMTSAFDDGEAYELTALGQQFVHYAMTETTVKIAYQPAAPSEESTQSVQAG